MRSRKSEQAAALILSLGAVAILTLLIVGFTFTMRNERQAAHFYVERARAELYAKEGIERVRGIILEATVPGKKWISMPGRMMVSDASGTLVELPLHSGATLTESTDTALAAPNLNRKVFSEDGTEAVTGAGGPPMPVSWIYVRKDGTRDNNQTPDTTDAGNPIVGRYAFWADDESSRININTAWKRQGNTASMSHPSKVNLLAIPGILASTATPTELVDKIHTASVANRFSSPDEARRLDPQLASILSANRFSLSHHSSSSNLNPWGEPKIFLTTKKANLPPEVAKRTDVDKYYLDVLTDETKDPGGTFLDPNLDQTRYAKNLNKLVAFLAKKDWPYGKGSFIDKYGYAESVQIASNIIEYVRGTESARPYVPAIRFTLPASPNPGQDNFDFGNVGVDRTIRSTTRGVMITEAGMQYGAAMTKPTRPAGDPYIVGPLGAGWAVKIKAELYLPAYPGVDPVDLTDVAFDYVVNDSMIYNFKLNASNADPVVLQPGGFSKITLNSFAGGIRPSAVNIRMILWLPGVAAGDRGNYRIWDIAPLSKQTRIPLTIDAVGGSETSVQVNDPRVNKFAANWVRGASTYGALNFNWTTPPASPIPTGQPPQDTDGSTVSSQGITYPSLKGSPTNPLGIVSSVAELGFIHTGIVGSVPWRTARLQPKSGTVNTLPDWVLLDLFSVPMQPMNSPPWLANVSANSSVGRININTTLNPFTTATRVVPLEAMFKDNPDFTDENIKVAASNIAKLEYADEGIKYGNGMGFVSVGELCEIRGVTDQGEANEKRLFGALDLATVRSNSFRVFSLGQSVKQTPNGRLMVEAERYTVAILDRTDTVPKVIFWKTLPQ